MRPRRVVPARQSGFRTLIRALAYRPLSAADLDSLVCPKEIQVDQQAKTLPATRSFLEWRRAADKLLKLERALSAGKLAVPAPPDSTTAELTAAVEKMRAMADSLFQVALLESDRLRMQALGEVSAAVGSPAPGFCRPDMA
ncbi:MAG: hypothetical protein JWQ33_2260 [Ramlibacter sp.]|nr:hypothetical protein [Ramlibacter sp.]